MTEKDVVSGTSTDNILWLTTIRSRLIALPTPQRVRTAVQLFAGEGMVDVYPLVEAMHEHRQFSLVTGDDGKNRLSPTPRAMPLVAAYPVASSVISRWPLSEAGSRVVAVAAELLPPPAMVQRPEHQQRGKHHERGDQRQQDGDRGEQAELPHRIERREQEC